MAYTTIKKPSLHFNTKIYSGNGSAGHAITGVGFQPDFVWLKRRDASAGHKLNDAVRGVNKQLVSNNTNAQNTDTNVLTAFGTDGFTLGDNSDVNNGSGTFVSWNWKAGTGAGSSNTDGSINTTYTSANTTAGFSISQYTGTGSAATIGHGLGAAPKVVLIKRTSTTGNWVFGHGSLGFTKFLEFTTGAAQTHSGRFNDTAPTSSVFSVGTTSEVNSSGATFIAYCFAEKTGYSKFGSFTGNASTNGTFIYTGFKPALFIIKNADASEHWRMYDNKRDSFNHMFRNLLPNHASAENTTDNASEEIDFLSNGIKIRSSAAQLNGAGNELIFMAFAAEPLVGDNPATAV